MRICITSPFIYPYKIGGAEKYASCLANSLAEIGQEVVILTSKLSAVQKTELFRNEVEEIHLKPWVSIGANPLTPRIVEIVKRERPDIVHVQAPTLYGDISILSGLLLQTSVVATFHGRITQSSAPDFLLGIYNAMYPNFTLNRCDRVIVTTRQNMRLLEQVGLKREMLSVIPVGVEKSLVNSNISQVSEERFNALTSPKRGMEKSKLLFVGALDKHHAYKGLENLLMALKLVVKQRMDVLLIVVGDGDRRSYYEALARELAIDQNVLFVGWASPDLLLIAYSRSDLFVLPSCSYSEGFGIVLLEAMSRGCPVLTTAFAGGAEAVRDADAGLVVDKVDPTGLSEAILHLLSDQNRLKQYGENGITAVRRKYTWDIIAKRILNIYNDHLYN